MNNNNNNREKTRFYIGEDDDSASPERGTPSTSSTTSPRNRGDGHGKSISSVDHMNKSRIQHFDEMLSTKNPEDGRSIDPIKQTESRIQHFDDMFDQIESLNQIMYEELLSLTNQSKDDNNTDRSNMTAEQLAILDARQGES